MPSLRQGPFTSPEALATAFLGGPPSPERIRKLLRHAKQGTRAAFDQLLVILPTAVRAEVERAAVNVRFAG